MNIRREDYIRDDSVVKRANAAVAIELEKIKAMNMLAVMYDSETKLIYHVYSDGTRVEIGKRLRRDGIVSAKNKKPENKHESERF